MTLVVAAIDFGTTYSSSASSFKHEFESDPTKCSAKTWSRNKLVSSKGPTCVLIKPDGKTADSFGFDAESRYATLAEEEVHTKWYYFRRFKMKLFTPQEGLKRGMLLDDESGKKLPAKRVFSLSIKLLKDDLFDTVNGRTSGVPLADTDIHWVLTVPAIWDDDAKQFMREAAQDAGIAENKLTIALEPEAASLYCHNLPIEKSGPGKLSLSSFGPGKRYLVLDAGGGTVDITVHEVLDEGYLKELHKANGGAWGGIKVDEAFLEFLEDIVGSKTMTEFKEKYMEDYIDLVTEFEMKKRSVEPEDGKKMTIRTPLAFLEMVKHYKQKTLDEMIKLSNYANDVNLIGDKLRVSQNIATGFFSKSLQSIADHLRKLLRAPQCKDLDTIVMVGGFSESPLLKNEIMKTFPRIQVIIPDEAGLAVLKGAVIFGHKPSMISSRVSKYTYGIDTTRKFDSTVHSQSKKKFLEDEWRCMDLFSTHVKSGDTLQVGKAQKVKRYNPIRPDQQRIGIHIYRAQNKVPTYIDDDGCHEVGYLSVPLPGHGKDRAVSVSMIFGGTEIEVECKNMQNGSIKKERINFIL